MKALILLVLMTVTALAAHVAASQLSAHKTAGPMWVGYLRRSVFLLGIPTFLAALLPRGGPIAALWSSGLHPWADTTSAGFLPGLAVAAIPLFVHFGLLGLGVAAASSTDPREARGLFGQAGFTSSNLWILVPALPLAALVIGESGSLGGERGYPVWQWSTELAVLLGLLGLALSRAAEISLPATTQTVPEPAKAPLSDWPAEMRARGLVFTTLYTLQPDRGAGVVPASSALVTEAPLHERVHAAFQHLVHGLEAGGSSPVLLRGPCDGGEAELAIAAARMLAARQQERCLLVAPRDGAGVVRRLRAGASRLRSPGPRVAPDREVAEWRWDQALPPDAPLCVVEADVLAEHLLPSLAGDTRRLQSIGCLIWWDCHEYSGLYAANMWAVSRRLDRLLRELGRRRPPSLVTVRESAAGSDQLSEFLQWLLPYQFGDGTTFVVPPQVHRPLHVHLLGDSQEAVFARVLPTGADRDASHPALLAAIASCNAGWPTTMATLRGIPAADAANVLAAAAMDRDRDLLPGSAEAGARVLEVEPGDVVSFLATFGAGGRVGPVDRPHHLAIVSPANPYLAYLLRSRPQSLTRLGRRLVPAKATPAQVQRQLVFALSELPDTFHGLRRTFGWQETLIRHTLDTLEAANRLTADEVRFLDEQGQLTVDRLYRTPQSPTSRVRFDVAGAGLFEVRELPALGATVRLWTDLERVPIAAYPGRVFFAEGKRFRVGEEKPTSHDAPWDGYVECRQEGKVVTTERIRTSRVADLRGVAGFGEVRFGRRLEFSRQLVDVRYREMVIGRVDLRRNLVDGTTTERANNFLRALETDFETRAILVRLPSLPGLSRQASFASLARALEIVLPVHVATDPDALAVVPVTDESVRDANGVDSPAASGVAIVDLFPGGMGLVDAIQTDDDLLLDLLRLIGRWVGECSCGSDAGCPACIAPPGVQALRSTQGASRRALKSLCDLVNDQVAVRQ